MLVPMLTHLPQLILWSDSLEFFFLFFLDHFSTGSSSSDKLSDEALESVGAGLFACFVLFWFMVFAI